MNKGEYLMQIRSWKAQRSGANIRVTGVDKGTQQAVKVTASHIEPRRGGLVVAVCKDGTEHQLVE
jgi:ribulose bisphosphate carboxylase small subunit